MKRVVFILVTLVLLLISEAVTLLATKAETAPQPLQAQALAFYYKQDETVRYLDLKNQWQSAHRGELPASKAVELANQAYADSSVDATLERWRQQGGPAPQTFSGKLHLYNAESSALLNTSLNVIVRARVGELRVNPLVQTTDYEHLDETAQWETVSTESIPIAAMAPGEDLQVEVMTFRLMDFLAKHPNRWPLQVEMEVNGSRMATIRKSIALVPDHFVVPVLY